MLWKMGNPNPENGNPGLVQTERTTVQVKTLFYFNVIIITIFEVNKKQQQQIELSSYKCLKSALLIKSMQLLVRLILQLSTVAYIYQVA